MKKKTVILCFIIFILLTVFLLFQNLAWLDDSFYHLIAPSITPKLTKIMLSITRLGEADVFLCLGTIVTMTIYFLHSKKFSFIFLSFFILTGASMYGFKLLFSRVRPTLQPLISMTSFSYPSGHAMMSIFIYGYLISFLFTKKNGFFKWIMISFLFFLTLAIGYSRIYLGVHYLSDILAGYCLGLLCLVVVIHFGRKINVQND